jgi:two-component system response regulator PhcR
VLVRERHPGALQQAIATSRQAIGHAIALVASAADSAHVDPPGAERRELTAAGLVDALLAGYPFVADERAWVVLETWRDFALPECPDLIFLVLSTLTRNALQALQNHENPCLRIQIGHATHVGYDCIRFIDNGPGFPRDLFPQLGRVQCTTRADSGGSGMGLVFARRVMESVSGTIEISTAAEGGACIELLFALPSPAPAVAPHFSLKELP